MASTPTFSPNPYGDFEPSQWTNPYSSFQSSGIPFPASYLGWPTDSMGNPIQPTPGMTLNSAPQPQPAQQAAPSGISPYSIAPGNPAIDAGNQAAGLMALNSMIPTGNNSYRAGPGTPPNYWSQGASAAPASQSAAAPAASRPLQVGDPITSQQYLSLLAHPNPVVTPGATVPQAPSSAQPGPGMLQQFLATYKPGASGPGSGFTNSFYKALGGT